MRHERGIEALDLLHPIIKCLVEARLAWQLSVSDIAARMGSSYFTLKRYERGAEFPSGKMTCSVSKLSCGTRSQLPQRQSVINLRIVP
jgi:hypothetical protein